MIEWLKAATDLGFAILEFMFVWLGIPVFAWMLVRACRHQFLDPPKEKEEKDG